MGKSAGRVGGKVVLIIGGTSGIGFSAARALRREGAVVTCTGRNPEKIATAQEMLGTGVEVVESDAQSSFQTERAIQDVVASRGRLDALYHVAGGSGRSVGDGPLHEITDEGWHATLRLNLDSVFYSNRAAIRQFLSQRSSGVLLNMASVLGFSPSPRYFATHAYASTKAAIIGLTKSEASYYAAQGIRVNAIAPGLVETPMAKRAAADDGIVRFARSKQPLDGGRLGLPEDYDSAAVFLLSEESRFMTGQTIVVDGGWSCSEGQYE